MSDQTPEPAPEPITELPPAFTPAQVENFLTLDQIMSSARRARRTAKICLAADLEADYLAAIDELGELVTADGELVEEDASMEDAAKVSELRDRIKDLRDKMAEQTFSVMFEAMNDDSWQLFEKKHRNKDGSIKDVREWQDELIAACAIKPTFTIEDVAAIRKKLGPTQIQELANQAYSACATGGVDAPKLPNYWHSPKPQESSQS